MKQKMPDLVNDTENTPRLKLQPVAHRDPRLRRVADQRRVVLNGARLHRDPEELCEADRITPSEPAAIESREAPLELNNGAFKRSREPR